MALCIVYLLGGKVKVKCLMIVLIWASTMLLKISCSRLLRLWKGLQSVMLKLFSKLFKKLKLLKFSVKGHDNFELTWPKSYYQWLIKYWKVLCWISSKIWKKSMTALWFQLNFVYCLFKFFCVNSMIVFISICGAQIFSLPFVKTTMKKMLI